MRLAVIALVIALAVGLHLMPPWIGTLGVLTLLVVSGLGLRLLRLFAGGLLFLIGLGV